MAVMIDSYGRARKVSFLAQSDISGITGLSRPRVTEALQELVARNILIKRSITENRTGDESTENRTRAKIAYEINKDYDTWSSVKPERSEKPYKDRTNASYARVRKKEKKELKSIAKKRFSPPKAEEVTAYAQQLGFTLNGDQFVDHYEAKGWRIGNTPMRSWQAAVRTWKRRERERFEQAKTSEDPRTWMRS